MASKLIIIAYFFFDMILEACVENLKEAILAERLGAHQIELCSDLIHDGLTPDDELVKAVLEEVSIPVKIMIRPRPGDFVYSEGELYQMKRSIEKYRSTQIAGYVIGINTEESKIDHTAINTCIANIGGKSITIHKAIDDCEDIIKAVETIKVHCPKVGFILSSGGRETAILGSQTLLQMQEAAGEGIQIIAAGKVTKANIDALHDKLNFKYYHGRRIVDSISK